MGGAWKEEMGRMKFLVAYDTSPTARRALDHTLGLMRPDRDSLVVLMIADEPPELLLSEQTVQQVTAARLHDVQRIMNALSQKLEEMQITHLTIAAHASDTAREILDTVEASQADMLVVGSRGMGTMHGYTMSRHPKPAPTLTQLGRTSAS